MCQGFRDCLKTGHDISGSVSESVSESAFMGITASRD